MSTTRVQFPVGSRRLKRNDTSAGAGATRDVRAQFRDIQKRFEAMIDAIEGATAEAVYEGLEPIYQKSQTLVPVKSGALKASGFIEVERRGSRISGVVGYARGSNPPYAAIVHERLDVQHESPTQAKFLEEAVMSELPFTRDRIVAAVRRTLGFGS